MSLKKSSLLVLLVLFTLFITSMLTNVWLLTRSNTSLDKVNKEIRVVLSIIDPINHSRTLRVRLMEYMKAMENSATLSSKPTLDGVNQVLSKADAAFQAYLAAPRLPDEQPLADAYRTAWLAYRQQGLEPLIGAATDNNRAAFDLQIPNVVRLDRQYEIVLDKVLARHEHYAKQLNATAQGNFTFGLGLIATFSLLFMIVIMAVLILLRRFVLAPLTLARDHCRQIAAGVLDKPLTVTPSRSEIQALINAMEQMRGSLTDIIRQVRHSAQTVSSASQDIAAGNTDLASRTGQQAAALTQTAASMEELGATVKQNNENVHEASRLTLQAVQNARAGDRVSRDVIKTMEQINSSSKKIEDIIGVINGIAFQTNILALNAAVEAARAGEQGRGFAVVAGEVRSLAQRSAVAAKEIEELIVASAASIQSGSQRVSETGEVINAIITSVTQIDALMNQISIASEEQSRGISQIEQAVTEMDSVTQQNAALVHQSADSSASLEDQVRHLTQAVSAFQLTTG